MRKVKDLKRAELVGLVEAIQSTLYPNNRLDHEWNSDTMSEVSAHLEHVGLVPSRMLEVRIAHLKVETETVTIPGDCPHCNANLREKHAVTLTELTPSTRFGAVEKGINGAEDQLTYDEDDVSDSCEGEICWISVNCNVCRKVVIHGRWEEK